uniref:Uncharacterized protein n=1 Tax=Knipowitschia caucasica TaxID=637954 RepID=A0AAV2JY93_KNICA
METSYLSGGKAVLRAGRPVGEEMPFNSRVMIQRSAGGYGPAAALGSLSDDFGFICGWRQQHMALAPGDYSCDHTGSCATATSTESHDCQNEGT